MAHDEHSLDRTDESPRVDASDLVVEDEQRQKSGIFRREALQHYAHGDAEGALLQLTPGWARFSYWMLLAVLAFALAYAFAGRVHEYAAGPAIVRVDGRLDLTARLDGTVATVSVQPGQHVVEGQPLVQLFTEQERAQLESLQQEFDLELLKELRDPGDQAARTNLSSLRAQRELATAKLAERLIRAPHDGVVSDVRVRPGGHLGVGDVILTLVNDDATLSLVALLPGRYRPMLHPGMPLRFELTGYRYEYRDLAIDSVGDEVVGPTEARRYLGPGLGDIVTIDEPVVLVHARLPSRQFTSNGEEFHYFDGQPAMAQARVRSEPIAVTLVPGLKALFHHGH